MHKNNKLKSVFTFAIFLLAHVLYGSDSTLVHSDALDWTLERQAGTFEPAGWSCSELLALTRVQGVRMGLTVDAFVDERFDPVKGKMAVAQYYGNTLKLHRMNELVSSQGGLLLSDIAAEAGVPLRLIESNNPHLRRDILPIGSVLYGVDAVFPAELISELAAKQIVYSEALAVQYERRRKQILSFMPDPSTHSVSTYIVRNGDYLGRISAKTGASLAELRKWNRINGNTIYAGQQLTIWIPKSKAPKPSTIAVVEPLLEQNVAKKELASIQNNDYVTYEVKLGDTLWGIAQKFPGVSADNIKSWNKVDLLIKAGEKLKINTQTISDYSPEKYPSTL